MFYNKTFECTDMSMIQHLQPPVLNLHDIHRGISKYNIKIQIHHIIPQLFCNILFFIIFCNDI